MISVKGYTVGREYNLKSEKGKKKFLLCKFIEFSPRKIGAELRSVRTGAPIRISLDKLQHIAEEV